MQPRQILAEIKQEFQKARNIHQKRALNEILEYIRQNGYMTSQIYASFGEDAAAIRPDPQNSNLILLTTDAIVPEFIHKYPWGAGFSAIYVSVEDIIAAGGLPIACSVTLSYDSDKMGKELFEGIVEGTHRFRVPLIRGHTRTNSPIISLTSTVIGQTDCQHFLSVKNLQSNDFIGLVFDPDGAPSTINRMYWDTITKTDPSTFYQKRNFIRSLIIKNYLHTCKDISNGGILGTIYQLCQYSGKGAQVNLDNLYQLNPFYASGYTLLELLSLFLTSGFIITGSSQFIPEITQEIKKSHLKFLNIGHFQDQKILSIQLQDSTQTVE